MSWIAKLAAFAARRKNRRPEIREMNRALTEIKRRAQELEMKVTISRDMAKQHPPMPDGCGGHRQDCGPFFVVFARHRCPDCFSLLCPHCTKCHASDCRSACAVCDRAQQEQKAKGGSGK